MWSNVTIPQKQLEILQKKAGFMSSLLSAFLEVKLSRPFGNSTEQKFSTGLRDGTRTELQGYST